MPTTDQPEKLRFPNRAPTRFWMFLNFVIFVGIATLGVVLVTIIGLTHEIHNATRESHIVDTEHIASLILSTDLISTDPDQWEEILNPEISTLLDFQDLFICIAQGDSVLWRNDPLEESDHHEKMLHHTTEEKPFFDIVSEDDRQKVQLGAVRKGDIVIGLVRPVSPLYILVSHIMFKIFLGFGFVFLMSMVGAWMASIKVLQPLKMIKEVTNRIVGGEYGTPIHIQSKAAEFQDLGHNVDQMSQSYMDKIIELEKVTKLQRDFITNISHEVRNPIFAISGFLEALGSSTLSKDHRQKYSARGLLNLKRLNTLFSSLIEIARIESHDHTLSYYRYNLALIVRDTKDLCAEKAQEKGIHLDLDETEIWVYIDHSLIERVFMNLIENAIQYSQTGTITCRFHKLDTKVRVEIIDEGRGIPKEELPMIFERFYRIDSSRSRRNGGSGLGLAIVKQILHEHGETIHVESTVGQGSRFWFELPLATDHTIS